MFQVQLDEHHMMNDWMEQVMEEIDAEILEYNSNAMDHNIQV